jgi:hypothetical protein
MALALFAAAIAWALAPRGERGLAHERVAILAPATGLLLSFANTACGGHAPPPPAGTPAGTYTLNVQGTAAAGTGALSHYVDLKLNVL